MIIPKQVLEKRLEGGPRSDEARRILDQAYDLCERAANDLRELDDSNTRMSGVGARAKFRTELAPRYLQQLEDLASPVASMRKEVEKGRAPYSGQLSPELTSLHNNASLADGALWSARAKLAELSGVSSRTFGA